MNARPAYSLIEMIVVISLLGVALGLVGSTVATVYQLDASVRRELAADEQLLSLESQLRRDVHACETASALGPDLYLQASENDFVLWTINATELTRESISKGEVWQRDRWPLPASHVAEWSHQRHDDVEWVALTAQGSGTVSRGVDIRCAVNRFAQRAEAAP